MEEQKRVNMVVVISGKEKVTVPPGFEFVEKRGTNSVVVYTGPADSAVETMKRDRQGRVAGQFETGQSMGI